jgi:hypothetical protein
VSTWNGTAALSGVSRRRLLPSRDGVPPAARGRSQRGRASRRTARLPPCRFDPIDFRGPRLAAVSGWPLSRAQLDPLYARALRVCGVEAGTYRLDDWASPASAPLPFDPTRVTTSLEHFGRGSAFTREGRDALERAPNVDVLVNATVGALEEAGGGPAVTHVRIVTGAGREHVVRATLFVLAAGGIENPRLLLLSRPVRSAGLGNQHDLVGRFFMDHHNVRSGFSSPRAAGADAPPSLYDLLRLVRGRRSWRSCASPGASRARSSCPNAAVRLEPGRAPDRIRAVGALRRARREGLAGGRQAVALARDVLVDAPAGGRGAAHARAAAPGALRVVELRAGRWRCDGFHVETRVEHAPDPANRVTLGEDRGRSRPRGRRSALAMERRRPREPPPRTGDPRRGVRASGCRASRASPVRPGDRAGGIHTTWGRRGCIPTSAEASSMPTAGSTATPNLFVGRQLRLPDRGYANTDAHDRSARRPSGGSSEGALGRSV